MRRSLPAPGVVRQWRVLRHRIGTGVLAALLALPACGGAASPPDAVRVASAADVTVAPAAGRVPQRGPFRRTARQAYVWRTAPVTAARLGSSHRPGCPTAVADLRLVSVTHWDLSGGTARGELVVHRDVVDDVVAVFGVLHAARFPLERMETVDRFGGDDARSMAANNTSGYNCRATTGGSGWSEHAYGRALDLNPVQNPYVRGASVEPAAGRAYLDRTQRHPGMVVAGDAVVQAFAAVGWEWGGDFRTLKDYQHFSQSGR